MRKRKRMDKKWKTITPRVSNILETIDPQVQQIILDIERLVAEKGLELFFRGVVLERVIKDLQTKSQEWLREE